MSRSMKRALTIYGVAVLVAAAAMHQQASPAHAFECVAVDQNDLPRDCTFLEEYGECLHGAADSLETCLDAATGFIGSGLCWVGYEIDFYACLPAELIKQVLSG